jgi:hypothetical protein
MIEPGTLPRSACERPNASSSGLEGIVEIVPGQDQGDDVQPLDAAGWTNEAIYCAIAVCALFNSYNRWINAAGYTLMSEEPHRTYSPRTAQHEYIRK